MKFFNRLATHSRRAFLRRTWHGRPYDYRPRGDLLKRLAAESGLSIAAVYEALQRERQEALKELP